MASALLRKSWCDLKRRKSRTIFTILTLAVGVTALSLFAVIPLINQGISDDIDACNMYDVRANINNLELNDTNFKQICISYERML